MQTQTSGLATGLWFSTCFAVSLLSTLPSSQVPASWTPFTETALTEVCPAKVRPRYFVLHQNLARVTKHHLSGSLHSDLNAERLVTAVRRPRDCSSSESSIRIPTLRLRKSPDIRRTCFDHPPLRQPLLPMSSSAFQRLLQDRSGRACARSSLQIPGTVC